MDRIYTLLQGYFNPQIVYFIPPDEINGDRINCDTASPFSWHPQNFMTPAEQPPGGGGEACNGGKMTLYSYFARNYSIIGQQCIIIKGLVEKCQFKICTNIHDTFLTRDGQIRSGCHSVFKVSVFKFI